MWVDGTFYRDESEYVDDCGALLVCDRAVAHRQFHHGLVTWVGDAALQKEPTATTLSCNGNTGCCAARWAIALGCRPVYLLGMEAAYQGDLTDFYGRNPCHHNTEADHGTVAVMRSELQRLKLDHPDNVVEIPDGLTLREVAAEHPEHSQDDLRRWVLQEIEQ